MSDNNIFKTALVKSKAFVADIKSGLSKGKTSSDTDNMKAGKNGDKTGHESDDDEGPNYANNSYNRRYRIVTDAERREYPLDLGENGWKDRRWSRVRAQYAAEAREKLERQKKEEKQRRKCELQLQKDIAVQEVMDSLQKYDDIEEEERKISPSTPNTTLPSSGGEKVKDLAQAEAAARQAFKSIPPRAGSTQPTQPPQPQQETSWFRHPSASTGLAARRLGLPPGETPLRVETKRPVRYAAPVMQQGQYNRKGAKIGSGDWGRETYLAKQGFKVKGKETQQHEEPEEQINEKKDREEAKKEVKEEDEKEDIPGSAVSRYADGIIKASGPTLW